MFQYKPDYEQTKKRIDAFWECELIDRPVTMFAMPKPESEWVPLPESRHVTPDERWLDTEYLVQSSLAQFENNEFMGDALPIAWPNLGPEIFSAFYGCPIHFGDYGTSWTDPILHDWADMDEIKFDPDSPYLKKLEEMTDALLDAGKDKFIVGMTDWHPGGDWLAAIRDPQNLALDMITNLAEVKQMLDMAEADYYRIYDEYYTKLRAAGMPITSWTPLVSDERYYIPSNDFSCMISPAMYQDVFLPGIKRECQFLDHSIYHLDGPGALRHIDTILAIPELNAMQWVFGAGNEGYDRWVWVYEKIQAVGKGAQVMCAFDEVQQVMETLNPRGVFLTISDIPNREAGLDLLDRLERWSTKQVWPSLK